MQVIPSACDACEEKMYEVSNMCRGCVAHPLQGDLSQRGDPHYKGEGGYRPGAVREVRKV